MKILSISGSIRKGSTNRFLLDYLSKQMPQDELEFCQMMETLPLFHPDLDKNPLPTSVRNFRTLVGNTDAVIISTPEYLHNIPAVLKNALEWLSSSGEFHQKPILAISYTPNAPRGEKAMQSLLATLLAMNARVLTSLALYHSDISFDSKGVVLQKEGEELIAEALALLSQTSS